MYIHITEATTLYYTSDSLTFNLCASTFPNKLTASGDIPPLVPSSNLDHDKMAVSERMHRSQLTCKQRL